MCVFVCVCIGACISLCMCVYKLVFVYFCLHACVCHMQSSAFKKDLNIIFIDIYGTVSCKITYLGSFQS